MSTLSIILLIGCVILLITTLSQVRAKVRAKETAEEFSDANRSLRHRNQRLNNTNKNLSGDLSALSKSSAVWQLASSNFDTKGDITVRVDNARNPNALKNGTVHFTLLNGKVTKAYIKKSNKSVPVFLCVKK